MIAAASLATTAAVVLDGLLRASLFLAIVLGVALVLALGLRRRAAARHALLCFALLAAALAPVWLALAAHAPVPLITTRASDGPVDGPLVQALGALVPRGPAPATAAARLGSERVGLALVALWLLGVGWALVRIGHGLMQARALRRRARPAPLASPGRFPLLVSDEIPAAVVVGVLRPAILIGPALLADESARVLVLAHELAHARRHDPLLGLLERLVAALYWFHPLVHVCVRAITRAREESCDDVAVAAGGETRYARTLLGLAGGDHPRPARSLLGVAHEARALEQRIGRLLGARPRALPAALAVSLGAGVALLLLAIAAPLAVALARPAHGVGPTPPEPQASPWHAQAERLLRSAGPGVEAAFVLRDIDRGDTVVVNPTLAQQRLTPASTYKMLIALLGLEAGIIAGPGTVLPWDGRVNDVPGWNQDLDLAGAMRTSATWYFQAIEHKLERAAIERTLQRLHYGNQSVATRDYWLDGSLTISALEQVDFLARLAGGQLPISQRARAVLDQVTRLDQRGDAVLFGKSGTAVGTAGTPGVIVWLVGHVEQGPRRHAFALVMRAPGNDSSGLRSKRVDLTRALLALHQAWPAEAQP